MSYRRRYEDDHSNQRDYHSQRTTDYRSQKHRSEQRKEPLKRLDFSAERAHDRRRQFDESYRRTESRHSHSFRDIERRRRETRQQHNRREHFNDRRDMKELPNNCFNCSSPYHSHLDCPHKNYGPRCYECGKFGHIGRVCYFRIGFPSRSDKRKKFDERSESDYQESESDYHESESDYQESESDADQSDNESQSESEFESDEKHSDDETQSENNFESDDEREQSDDESQSENHLESDEKHEQSDDETSSKNDLDVMVITKTKTYGVDTTVQLSRQQVLDELKNIKKIEEVLQWRKQMLETRLGLLELEN